MPMRIGTPMPSLDGATEWMSGSAGEALKETEGHPVLVHFWSLSCGMCKENLPRVAEWREKYAAAGVRLIGIQMPRYHADNATKGVGEAVTQYGNIDPGAIDNENKVQDAFPNYHGNDPANYMFDDQHN